MWAEMVPLYFLFKPIARKERNASNLVSENRQLADEVGWVEDSRYCDISLLSCLRFKRDASRNGRSFRGESGSSQH